MRFLDRLRRKKSEPDAPAASADGQSPDQLDEEQRRARATMEREGEEQRENPPAPGA